MKIGIDIHGVITAFPEFFAAFAAEHIARGDEIHLITGKQWAMALPKVEKLGIPHTHHYSIVDHHLHSGTSMEMKNSGWWMDPVTWNRSKGDYCLQAGIRMHFDNDIQYAAYFPPECTFIWVREPGFSSFIETFRHNPSL